jgi:hypothetical protein
MDPPWQTGGAQQAHANLKRERNKNSDIVNA